MEDYFRERIDISVCDNLNKTDTVISASLFTCDNSYNRVNFYINGLIQTINYFKLVKIDCKFLVFYDNPVVIELLPKFDNLLFSRFSFPEFSNGNNHIGMFGTLIRYIPMFLEEFKYNYLYIIDCDVQNEYTLYSRRKMFTEFIRSGSNIHVLTISSAPLNTRYEGMKIDLKTWIRITGEGIILKKVKFPISILYDFIHAYLNSEDYEYHLREQLKQSIYENKIKEDYGKFIYGVDEFMLVFLMKYIEDYDIVYSIAPYRYKLPFYYWYEKEATDEKKSEINRLLQIDDLLEFVKKFRYSQRYIIFETIFNKIPDLSEFFSPVIIDCLKRERKYLEFTYCIQS